jgi:hypothetical protein
MDVTHFERRMRMLEDVEAIRALKSRYFSACDRKDPKGMRACFVDGPCVIDYGVVGVFDTADAVVKVFTEVGCHPHMVEMHHGANPDIYELELSSAKGRWSLHYFLINTNEKKLTQLAGVYEDEYRRTDTGWKIAKTKFVATSTLVIDYTDTVAKALFAGRPG